MIYFELQMMFVQCGANKHLSFYLRIYHVEIISCQVTRSCKLYSFLLRTTSSDIAPILIRPLHLLIGLHWVLIIIFSSRTYIYVWEILYFNILLLHSMAPGYFLKKFWQAYCQQLQNMQSRNSYKRISFDSVLGIKLGRAGQKLKIFNKMFFFWSQFFVARFVCCLFYIRQESETIDCIFCRQCHIDDRRFSLYSIVSDLDRRSKWQHVCHLIHTNAVSDSIKFLLLVLRLLLCINLRIRKLVSSWVAVDPV